MVKEMDHALLESMEDGIRMIISNLLKVILNNITLECKKYYKQWKTIQKSFPELSVEDIRSHANAFFNKINSIRPYKMSILDFMQKNTLEYFKDITFDNLPANQYNSPKEVPDLFEEDKYSPEERKSEDYKVEDVKEDQEKRQYIPTQSQVMISALEVSTREMIKLMQNLVKDLQKHGEKIQGCSNTAGYWGYIYNSAVYLQQIINDVTVAHNSTLTYMLE